MKKGQEKLDKYRVKRLSRESIEAEEIFLDSKRLKETPESEREKMESPIARGKIHFLYILILVFILILFIRAVDLQIIKGNYWRKLAEENRVRSYPIKSLRGIIYDKDNKPLVKNEPRFDLAIVPADLLKQTNEISGILNSLSKILDKPEEELKTLIEKNAGFSIPVIVKENISKDTALLLESKFAENSAILVEVNSQRNYIDGSYFSHILGYLGRANKEDLQRYSDYLADDYLGKTGIELYYEDLLRGSYGERLVEVDSYGKIKNIFARKEAQQGEDIILSIDSDLQKKLYNEIRSMLLQLGVNKAAGIALDPNTGKILALVSFPGFDNNKFIQGFSEKDFEKLLNNSSKPFLNRVISGTYPPGSTVKPLIASAVLQEKILAPNQNINCTGSITIYNKFYPNIFRVYHDWTVHGLTNITKAIAESCDVYFYIAGGGYGNIVGLGIEKISQYLNKFGLGSVLGIDLPQEAKGFIPDENWKRQTKEEDWYIGDTYNVSIGQGDLLVTPLQMALATAVVANGGTLFKPQISEKIGNTLISPEIIRSNFINKEFLDIVKKGMREAVIYGTAKALYDLPVKVAGKTGTAQAPHGTSHAWFTAFAPYENPTITLAILIENGGEGSIVAAPIAEEVLRWYFSK